MLTKLIKYEFKASGRVIPLVLLASILLAAAGGVISLSTNLPLLFLSYMLLQLAGTAALVTTYIVIFVRFYKGMYGAEGYLAHTLPADAKTLYASKAIVSTAWLIVGTIISMVTYGVAFLLLFEATPPPDNSEELFAGLSSALSQFLNPLFIGWMAASTLIGILSFLAIVFFCITLSGVKPFAKLGIGSSILAYIAISIVNQIVTMIIVATVPFGMKFTIDGGWRLTNQTMWNWMINTFLSPETDSGFVISLGLNVPALLLAVALPIVTVRLMERKMILK